MRHIYKLLVCLVVVTCSAFKAQAADIDYFGNNHDAWFTPGSVDNCKLTYEFCVHHGNNDDGFRSDEGGANVYLNIDGVEYHLFNIKHAEDYFDFPTYEWKSGKEELEKLGWEFDLNELSASSSLRKYGDTSGHCSNYHYYYSKIELTIPATFLNKTYKFRIKGRWWRWGDGWADEQVDQTTKEIVASKEILVGSLAMSNLAIDSNRQLSVVASLNSEQNCGAHVKNYISYMDKNEHKYEFWGYGSAVRLDTARFVAWSADSIRLRGTIWSSELALISKNDPVMYYRGYPYARITSADFDVETRRITLNWEVTGDTARHYIKNGVWRIYRKSASGGGEYLLTPKGLQLTDNTYIDESIDYNKEYTYYICYHHNDWNFDTFDELKTSIAGVGTSTNPSLQIKSESEEKLVRLVAHFTPTRTDGFYRLQIKRDDKTVSMYDKLVPAGVDSVVWEDVHSTENILSRRQPHTYRIYLYRTKFGEECVGSTECTAAVNQYTSVENFRASQGTYSNQVRLAWDLLRAFSNYYADDFILSRKEVGDSISDYEELTRISTRERNATYSDRSALPGINYQYRLTLMGDSINQAVTQLETIGNLNCVGKIGGRITYPNRTAVAGVTVVIQAKSTSETTSNIELGGNLPSRWEVKTDKDGCFLQDGIPYVGEGTTYTVTPMFGTHEFSPSQNLVYMSQNSLAHTDVNFNDKSSFKVSGKVTYKYGDFPVEGAKILVDGEEVMRDGKNLCTDYNGEYLVEVPSGKHYISVKMDHHNFTYNGRFPSEEGSYYDFYQNETGLNFTDETLITIRGRVAGGVRQAELPLCTGYDGGSRANIGRATLMLKPVSNMSYVMNLDEEKSIEIDNGDNNVKSHTYLLPYNREGGTNQAQIKILTDSTSGEFCAKLPPLSYMVMTGSTASVPADSLRAFDIPQLNPVVGTEYVEKSKDGKQSCKYHAAAIVAYQAKPELEITDVENEDGAFGLDTLNFDGNIFRMYEKDNDKIKYTLGYPVYRENKFLRLHLKGYQRYTNMDTGQPVETLEPLSGIVVEFGDSWGQPTRKEGRFVTLNENGLGDYMIITGSPLQESEMHERQLQAVMSVGNRTYVFPDEPLRAIMLGVDISSGKGFIVQGPDIPCYVLRDPPGSESFSELYEGSSITSTLAETTTGTYTTTGHAEFKIGANSFGFKWDTPGHWVSKSSLAFALYFQQFVDNYIEHTRDKTTTATYTTTIDKTIRTGSDANNVGSRGDVYIGNGTAEAFGRGYAYNIVKELPTKLYDDNYITLDDGNGHKAYLCAYETFMNIVALEKTYFAFSQHYIESELLPEVERIRNSYIQPKGTEPYYNPNDEHPAAYISTVDVDDENFGKETYYEWKTKDGGDGINVVQKMNKYIDNWKKIIDANNKEKDDFVYTDNNSQSIGFSSGASYTESYTYKTDNSHVRDTITTETMARFGGVYIDHVNGFYIKGGGNGGNKYVDAYGHDHVSDTLSTIKVGYTLKDTDQYDNFLVRIASPVDSIEIVKDDSTHNETKKRYVSSPIFKVVGGASTRPWEEGTVPVQKCKFWLDKANITDVPSGSEIPLVFYAKNESAIDVGQGYILRVQEGSNDKGLIMMMDGSPIGAEGRDLWISPGQTIQKTIMLRQTNPDVLDYENIDLFMCGDKTQGFEMKNTMLVPRAQFSVHFKPSSSPSTLIARDMLDMKTDYVNIATGDSLKMEVTDFDLNYSGFYKLAIQMKGAADTEWLTIHTWGVNDSIKIADGLDEVIGKQSTLRYTYSMHELADQTYEFRTLTYANYGFEDITRASNTLTIVKDMVAPRLLGAASPKGGILTCDDEVSLQFNEDIYGTRITNANIRVMGELNRQETSHQTGLKFEGGDPVDTQGQITLTNDGITAEIWVRNDKPDNHSVLFQHTGEPDAFKAGFTADNKVWISAGGKTFVTPEAMKADGWQYLCVGMKKDKENKTHFFCDNWYSYIDQQHNRLEETNRHFDENVDTLNYNKRGRVILGSDFTGLVGSLMLWNKERGFDNEFEDRIYSPTGREEGLAGYWPMTECHGTVAADKVRERNLNLGSEERWYTARDNYSAEFTGENELRYMGGGIALSDDDDFCLQMWVKDDNAGSTSSPTEATLFATENENVADGGHLSLLMKKGTPVLRAEGQEYALTIQPLSANQWHNLTLNVQRGSSITFYVDGDAVRTLPVTAVGFVMDDAISVGKGFKGNIDEVRFWKASMSKSALQYNLYNRVDSTHTGLLMYLPMDRQTQYTGTEVWKTDPDFSNQSQEYVPLLNETGLPAATMKAPSLAPVRNMRQIAHDWVVSKDKLVINMTEDLYQIEGTTVQFCVDRIADLHGNEIGAPIYWTAFVDMNRLVWEGDTQFEMEAKLFEPLSFNMTIANNGSSADEWELTNLPSWLHASETSGHISPLSTQKITFTLTEGTPVGTYEAIVGLRGNNRVSEPLNVTIHVLGDRPDWKVNKHDYMASATMIAEVDIDGYLDEDVNDLVGAFIGDKCVGVDNLRYYKMMDKYLLMMSIYGSNFDSSISNKPIQFRIWDASTGLIYPQVAVLDQQAVTVTPTYRDDAIWGTPTMPYKLKANDVVEQQVRLGANWNWVSFFIDPGQGQRTVNDLFKTGRAGSQLKTQDVFYDFSQSENAWLLNGSVASEDLDLTNMYMVKTTEPVNYYVSGRQLSVQDKPITLHSGWSWIGYTPFESILINSALADVEPNEGDLIKGQTAFAQYTRAGWVGNLTYLTPGQGYIYHNTSAQEKTFRYPQRYTATYNTVQAKPRMISEHFSKFPATMNMTVRVVNDNQSTGSGQAPTGSMMALTGYDMREEAKAETAGLYWMSIHGNEAETDFCLVYYDEQAKLYYVGDERLRYKSNTVIGNYDEPYIFDLSKARVCTSAEEVATAIRDVKANAAEDNEYVYDLSGRRVHRNANRGVFISNGKKIVK